jgi:hypothetical protein
VGLQPRPTREVVFGAYFLEANTATGKGGRAAPADSGEDCNGRARAVTPPPEDEAAPAENSERADETAPQPETAGTSLTQVTAVCGTLRIGTTAFSQLGAFRLGAMYGPRPQWAIARDVSPVAQLENKLGLNGCGKSQWLRYARCARYTTINTAR